MSWTDLKLVKGKLFDFSCSSTRLLRTICLSLPKPRKSSSFIAPAIQGASINLLRTCTATGIPIVSVTKITILIPNLTRRYIQIQCKTDINNKLVENTYNNKKIQNLIQALGSIHLTEWRILFTMVTDVSTRQDSFPCTNIR